MSTFLTNLSHNIPWWGQQFQSCCCWRSSAITLKIWFFFLFFSCTQQTQEHKLKMRTHRDLRSITCIWQTGFIYFSSTQTLYKMYFSLKSRAKESIFSWTLSLQYLQTVSFGSKGNCSGSTMFPQCTSYSSFGTHKRFLYFISTSHSK